MCKHSNTCIYTSAQTHTPVISNDDLCCAQKAGMHNCSTHKHTQIQSEMNSGKYTGYFWLFFIVSRTSVKILQDEYITATVCSGESALEKLHIKRNGMNKS